MTQVKRTTTRKRPPTKKPPPKKEEPTTPPAGRGKVRDLLAAPEAPAALRYLKLMFFGPPKTGKTKQALSGKGKKLLILFEPDGDLVIKKHNIKGVDVVRPSNWAETEKIVLGLHTTYAGKYQWIILDSVTFMIHALGGKEVFEVLRENRDPRRAFMKSGASVNQLLMDLVALETNVIFLAQIALDFPDEEAGEDPLDSEIGEHPWTVAVQPMVYKLLTPMVSAIGRTYKTVGYQEKGKAKKREKKVEYWTSFEDYGQSPAGTRIPVPEQVQDLNLDDLLATIKED